MMVTGIGVTLVKGTGYRLRLWGHLLKERDVPLWMRPGAIERGYNDGLFSSAFATLEIGGACQPWERTLLGLEGPRVTKSIVLGLLAYNAVHDQDADSVLTR